MPTLYNIEADVDIDPSEFIESCSDKEIDKIIKYLAKNKYISDENFEESKMGIWESEFIEQLNIIKKNYYNLSKDNLNTIEEIYTKYKYNG